MSKTLWQIFKATPVVLATSLIAANSSFAEETNFSSETQAVPESEILEQINGYSEQNNSNALDQINNVSQLQDVSPGDWAFEALRNLVERYGCIAGYPDGTYRGNRALTRYEFAAGLNSCLQQIERVIAASSADFVTRDDLQTLERLVQEFEAELATLGTRVDNLEGRVGFLEENQFSTTTKLSGEAIFSLASAFGDDEALDVEPVTGETVSTGDLDENLDIDENVVFNDRVRLNFNTSFTGEDRLRVRLQAGNFPNFGEVTGTETARLGYEAGDFDEANDVEITELWYRFPVGDKINVFIGANELELDDMFDVTNPYFESSGSGSLNRFLRRNPAVFRNGVSQSVGANIQLNDAITVNLAYLTGDGSDPTNKDGLFDGDYTAAAQINFDLNETLGLGFTYAHSFYPGEDVNLSGSTSSLIAKRPFGRVATSADRFGIQASWQVTPKINIAGWGGLVFADAESGPNEGADAEIWNWAANVAFLDVGKEGAVLGFLGGMPPKATDVDGLPENDDTSYIIEAQYRYPITENIMITPGAYVIFNPNHNDDNDEIWVGVIRTTFSF